MGFATLNRYKPIRSTFGVKALYLEKPLLTNKIRVVLGAGVEPARLAVPEPKSGVSAIPPPEPTASGRIYCLRAGGKPLRGYLGALPERRPHVSVELLACFSGLE